MTNATFSKGTEVIYFVPMLETGIVYVDKFTIVSWGKVRGTVKSTETGNMSETGFNTTAVNTGRDVFVKASEVTDIEQKAIAIAFVAVEEERNRLMNCGADAERIAKRIAALPAAFTVQIR